MSKRHHNNISTSKKPEIDICILTAGRFDMLEKCLEVLYQEAQTVPLSINIFDNGCDPKERSQHLELFQYAPEKDPAKNVTYRTKHSSQNLGFPYGSNEAAKMGNANLIMFLGDDVELQLGTIQKVVKDFQEPSIGVVGIKLLFPLTSTHPNRPAGKVQHIGMAINVRGEPIHPLVGWSADNPKCCISRDVWAVTGACFTIRRTLFNKFRGFNLEYGLGTHEDLDLCMQVRQVGSRVWMDAEAKGYHYVGATAEKLQASFPLQQNRNIFLSRWQNTGQIFWNEDMYW